ncbi:Flp pilus assembly complex ATPase component TadA [Marinobacterium sp. 3-1745]|uniref:Flp pilus assembly complex ATPase component TadA n=2 Tax=Marinobacterium marinum TaxID=2756129 RepID=A0A7W2ABG1_9GAMM|nr:Flp pilus assembly complex ATPase component TadA [Marinobacterium marinum]
MGGLIGQVLLKLGLVSEKDLLEALSEQLDVPVVSAEEYPEEPVRLNGLSSDFLASNNVVLLKNAGGVLVCSAAMPHSDYIRKGLELATGLSVELRLGAESDIQAALEKALASDTAEAEDEVAQDIDGGAFIEHLKDLASEAPVIRAVNKIIHQALDYGASDIHLEPFDDGLHLRYRVDGVIEQYEAPASALAAAIVSRIKILAQMDIAERRLPQDGRIMTRVKGREIDLRVSSIPTVHGEGLVLRVLDRQSINLSLSKMGFSADTLKRYTQLLHKPHGVLLLTGPTGSGKTTTLYASLASLDADKLKIITVEDPVEYQLHGINQIQVQSQIDLSFARSLRSILRQDPDIIMIGEMRDTETAQIAVQSALTGHLVLSTLHTNTAAGAITRLEDMGVERYLVTAAVNGVLAQRLLRRLCSHCKTEVEVEAGVARDTGLERWLGDGAAQIFNANGCEACKYTGYSGRTAIHELFVLDSDVQKAIQSGAGVSELHELACRKGMHTLYEDGLRKVAAGETSLEELLRITQDQDGDDGV